VLETLEIRSYQSLAHLKLRLGRFTVVTGPTGSGKSAIIRALRLLAFNARGTSYITRGQKTCAVVLAGKDWQASVQRGSRGQDKYELSAGPPYGTAEYTKLAGQVPADVSRLLGLTSLNFASQFDRPFLLDDSGAEIARTLGRLTNVTLLFGAAREGNRRRLQISNELKMAEADLDMLRQRAREPRFARLAERRTAVQEAEGVLAGAQRLQARRDRLRLLLGRLRDAQEALGAVPVLPDLPDMGTVVDALARADSLRELIGRWRAEQQLLEQAQVAEAEAGDRQHEAEDELHVLLDEAGVCPTCGRLWRST
jgi:DNA repair protein SbcC/Rad50